MKAMPSSRLFPVELPALTFDSRSLSLIDSSTAAQQLFKQKLEGAESLNAADFLRPRTKAEHTGSEAELDQLRERLSHLSYRSEQLPWGDCITLEYYAGYGEDGAPETADVLVSSRQNEGLATFTILFLRPSERRFPRPSSPPTPHSMSSDATSHSFSDQLLPATQNGGGGGSIESGSASTPSVRSASFSSSDKRPRPTTGKEREKLPLSAETTYLLSRATARVSADNVSSPRPATSSLRPLPPLSVHSSSSFDSGHSSTSAPSATSNAASGPDAVEKEKAVQGMHTIFKNSPVYHANSSTPSSEASTTEPSSTDSKMDVETEESTKQKAGETEAPAEGENGKPTPTSAPRIPLTYERLSNLIETEPLALYITDAEGQVQWLNDAWYRYTGLDSRYHPDFTEWITVFHPDDLPKALEIYLNAMKTGEDFAMEYRIRDKDGNMKWNVSHGRAHKDADGKILGWACCITPVDDMIHARHAAVLSQERIKAVLEGSQTLLISVNTKLEVDFLEGSLSLPDVLASNPQSTSLHCHLEDLLHSEKLTIAAQRILDEEETEIGLDHEFTGVEGRKSYVRFRLVPILGDPSIPVTSPDFAAVTGVIIVGVNVTEAIKVENELQKSRLEQVELESREKAKTDFLTTMSHELRTPTAQILGVLELVLADKENPLLADHRSLLEQAIRSGDALLELIGAVLDVRKVEAGQLKLETQPFLLSEVIEDARLFSVTAQSKGLTFKEEIGDFYHGTVLGDRLRLRQVLTNALSNAVKFTSKGGIVLRARQKLENDEKLWLQVEVQDSGVGIEESVLPTLFQPFRQAHAGTAREFGGTGLGLVISKKLVELMDGEVELVSEYGRGTIFKICLPIAKAPLVDVKDFVGSTHPVPPATALEGLKIDETNKVVAEAKQRRTPQNIRVLLAEDNKLIRDIVSRTLKGMKFHVDAVVDGLECLAQLEKEDYDVILMDGQMPRLDGYEASRCIKQNPLKCKTRIIALTASAISGDKERCIAAGMDSYLAKPVRSNDLQRSIFEQIDLLDALPQ